MVNTYHGYLGHGDTHKRVTYINNDLHLDLSDLEPDLSSNKKSAGHLFDFSDGRSHRSATCVKRALFCWVESFTDFIVKNLVRIIRCVLRMSMTLFRRGGQRYLVLVAVSLFMVYFVLWKSQVKPVAIPDYELDSVEIERQLSIQKRLQWVTYEPPKKKENKEMLKNGEMNEDAIEKFESRRRLKYHRVWQWADKAINKRELFSDEPEVDSVLEALAEAPIVSVEVLDLEEYESGTAEKWVAVLEGGQKVMIKLIWEKGSKGKMKPHAMCNFGHEMPASEIAAFHLHKVLGMRNTPFVAGRRIDLVKEILPVANPSVAKQIVKEGNRTCVRGKCFHCESYDLLCPEDGFLETSVSYWIPRHLKLFTYPPKYMPFSTPRMEQWGGIAMNNRSYCDKIKNNLRPYDITRYYHDLFDFAVVDTLMYHYDTKHYVIYDHSDAHGLTVRLDHGRAFCAWDKDEYDVFIAPLHQCCTLRWQTYLGLDGLKLPGQLTAELKRSLSKDRLAPILDESHYPALERRLVRILNTIQQCADVNGGKNNILVA